MRMPTISRRSRAGIGVILAATLVVLIPMGTAVVLADHVPVHGTILARGPFADPFSMKIKT